MPHKLGAMVNDVATRTGAANIGLMVGDIITSYDGNKITPEKFSAFASALTTNRPKIEICLISKNTENCDLLVLASRLQPVH
jgi:S1-C subfamily serine protease